MCLRDPQRTTDGQTVEDLQLRCTGSIGIQAIGSISKNYGNKHVNEDIYRRVGSTHDNKLPNLKLEQLQLIWGCWERDASTVLMRSATNPKLHHAVHAFIGGVSTRPVMNEWDETTCPCSVALVEFLELIDLIARTSD